MTKKKKKKHLCCLFTYCQSSPNLQTPDSDQYHSQLPSKFVHLVYRKPIPYPSICDQSGWVFPSGEFQYNLLEQSWSSRYVQREKNKFQSFFLHFRKTYQVSDTTYKLRLVKFSSWKIVPCFHFLMTPLWIIYKSSKKLTLNLQDKFRQIKEKAKSFPFNHQYHKMWCFKIQKWYFLPDVIGVAASKKCCKNVKDITLSF